MAESARLNGSLNEIELGFVEREATPRLLMDFGIQLHQACLSPPNKVFNIDTYRLR
jgi:putative transposase